MGDTKVELIHIEQFLSLFEGLEIEKLDRQKPPEPDFLAKTNQGLIGIEHTRLFKKKDENGVDPVLHEREAHILLQEAEAAFNKITKVGIHVSVSFRLDYGIKVSNPIWLSSHRRKELVPLLVDFVLNNIPEKGKRLIFPSPNNFGNYILPKSIRRIHIHRTPMLSNSSWNLTASHIVPKLISGSQIKALLKKKSNKPSNYKQKYDNLWLVIVTNKFRTSQDFDFDISELPTAETLFDKVFIYRHGENLYHELPKTYTNI